MGRQKNEGEGNRTAARQYNKDQQEFIKSGKVKEAAEKAKEAIEGDEAERLRSAERTGRSKARS